MDAQCLRYSVAGSRINTSKSLRNHLKILNYSKNILKLFSYPQFLNKLINNLTQNNLSLVYYTYQINIYLYGIIFI